MSDPTQRPQPENPEASPREELELVNPPVQADPPLKPGTTDPGANTTSLVNIGSLRVGNICSSGPTGAPTSYLANPRKIINVQKYKKPSGSRRGAIIIDHTTVNRFAAAIILQTSPAYYIKRDVKFHICGRSHTSQLADLRERADCGYPNSPCDGYTYCDGLPMLSEIYPVCGFSAGQASLPTTADSLCTYKGMPGNRLYNYSSDYWDGNGPNLVDQLLAENPTLNISLFTWCADMNTASEAFVQEYLEQLDSFGTSYPNVTFVYCTGNASLSDGGGAKTDTELYNRYLRNTQIRNYCNTNDKVLFDFGDLDCWYYDGANWQQNTVVVSYGGNDYTIPAEWSTYYNWGKCGHATMDSRVQKAKALWVMLAEIRGLI